jgi:hypothetical protein
MTTTIVKGKLCISIGDLLDNIAPEDKSELLKHIACDSQVIADVVAQILDGWTEDGWHGRKAIEASANPPVWEAIDRAQREIAKRSGEVAKREIERLEKALSAEQKRRQDLEDEKRNAWHKRESIL